MIRSFHVPAVILLVIVGLGVAMTGCTSPSPGTTAVPTNPTPAPVVMTSSVPAMTMTPSAPVLTSTADPLATNSPAPSGRTTSVTLTSENFLFDQKTITVPAGSTVVMTFVNKDAGVPHNFALYTDTTAGKKIFVGEIINGVKTTTYTFTAPSTPGNYFFRCDVHPTIMFGTFVVT